MCLGDWKTHGSEYYECSRYKENPDIVNQSQQAQAREALKKYLFYFERVRWIWIATITDGYMTLLLTLSVCMEFSEPFGSIKLCVTWLGDMNYIKHLCVARVTVSVRWFVYLLALHSFQHMWCQPAQYIKNKWTIVLIHAVHFQG